MDNQLLNNRKVGKFRFKLNLISHLFFGKIACYKIIDLYILFLILKNRNARE